LFEDLQEAMYLMENASGLRPYQVEWFERVFLPTFNEKENEPDHKMRSNNDTVYEDIVAVTTEQLAAKNKQVYGRILTSQKIDETYLEPLINEGYVDSANSMIDKRAKIYYPLVENVTMFDVSTEKDKKLFEKAQLNNLFQHLRLIVKDPENYPDKHNISLEIRGVQKYSIEKGLQTVIKDSNWHDMNIDELIDKYYGNPENSFKIGSIFEAEK
jgi:hypothetical protein